MGGVREWSRVRLRGELQQQHTVLELDVAVDERNLVQGSYAFDDLQAYLQPQHLAPQPRQVCQRNAGPGQRQRHLVGRVHGGI